MENNIAHQDSFFRGFDEVSLQDFWPYPNFLEEYWYCLSGSEQKVLTFIMRQTIGFKKQWDWLAISQFTHGIGKRNKGTGLSRSQVVRALKSLESKGFITATHYKSRVNRFSLIYRSGDRVVFKMD
jgi:DNA-binding MarR family transcriptional regulator